MSGRVKRITEVVKQYDRRLFANEALGKVMIMRQADRVEASDYNQSAPDIARLNPQLVFALTHNWNVHGSPVEWGLEPIMAQLRSMDGWSDPGMFKDMVKKRERDEADKQRSNRNDIRARAADMRTEFARSTNDINTGSLNKVDRRRNNNGDS